MPKKTMEMQETDRPEQEQKAVAVSVGGAADQITVRNIRLIIGREYKNRVTQRSFIISTIILLILVVLGAFVPTVVQYFVSAAPAQTNIAVVNNAGPIAGLSGDSLTSYIGTALNGTATQATGATTTKPLFNITLQPGDALGSLQNQVKHGSLSIVLVIPTKRSIRLINLLYDPRRFPDNANERRDCDCSSLCWFTLQVL